MRRRPHVAAAPGAKRVSAVLDARRDEITARCRDVTATALGLADPGTTPWRGRVYAVTVGLRSDADLPARQVYYLDGVPMRFFVAGTFTAQ
jgi:hypothetical protein